MVKERPCRKAIHFDLSTKKMKELLGSRTRGYSMLKRAFEQYDFTHRQYSGYVSNGAITTSDVYKVLTDITAKHSWLMECARRMDVTNVGRTFDLLPYLRDMKAGESALCGDPKSEALKAAISRGSGGDGRPLKEKGSTARKGAQGAKSGNVQIRRRSPDNSGGAGL